ncbi:NYN domain-containing protein [Methanohalophilus mahii]|uniref:NYN domain-containing protein n=1 Tax=Methanohalophilus mahii (strain ATCC 35705 / DSM 5219 / SLP) TaxID=547558 RepID=D5EBR7_METMS|nr:NYN domain-containing protein [Methanohalophilus mahii]ADE36618.1 protein of unknown function DUF88 [Methanohalophilus mahii DSM 5219]
MDVLILPLSNPVYGPTPVPSYRRMMVFIDGENLVFNYLSLLKNGKVPNDPVQHEKDVFVWHINSVVNPQFHEIIRANYYTYITGSDETIIDQIKKLAYARPPRSKLPHNLYPVVFKKPKKRAQSKGVDIQMTVDILSQVYNNNIDTVYLFAGDGDYLPVINEAIRMGKQVYLAAFSHGLNKKLVNKVDQFHLLDDIYFEQIAESSE